MTVKPFLSYLEKKFGKRSGTIMFPTNHDITPINVNECLDALLKMLRAGNKVLIVSKPHIACVRKITKECVEHNRQILFRFTIGSASDEVLRFWEPGAPNFSERLEALKTAFEAGYYTSVSCEPMLDDDIGRVVNEAKIYVTDAIWLGKANFLVERLKTNGEYDEETARRAAQLLEWQRDDRIRLLYKFYQKNSMIKWKESIKRVVGLKIPTRAGLDI
jgi:DNA repair photolyase